MPHSTGFLWAASLISRNQRLFCVRLHAGHPFCLGTNIVHHCWNDDFSFSFPQGELALESLLHGWRECKHFLYLLCCFSLSWYFSVLLPLQVVHSALPPFCSSVRGLFFVFRLLFRGSYGKWFYFFPSCLISEITFWGTILLWVSTLSLCFFLCHTLTMSIFMVLQVAKLLWNNLTSV
jgi:hypothetical protein